MKGTKSDRETLRTRVKDALGSRTQKDLEQQLEVSGGTMSRVFGGRRNVDADFLRALADALEVDVQRLLHGTDFLLLFDEAELPREAGDVDVVAPLPPEPEAGPAPVESLPSRGGGAAEPTPDAPNTDEVDPPRTVRASEAPTADLPDEPDASETSVPLADRDTEPTLTAVDVPRDIAKTPRATNAPRAPNNDRTVSVDETVPPAPPRGLGGRIRRFLSSLFGG